LARVSFVLAERAPGDVGDRGDGGGQDVIAEESRLKRSQKGKAPKKFDEFYAEEPEPFSSLSFPFQISSPGSERESPLPLWPRRKRCESQISVSKREILLLLAARASRETAEAATGAGEGRRGIFKGGEERKRKKKNDSLRCWLTRDSVALAHERLRGKSGGGAEH